MFCKYNQLKLIEVNAKANFWTVKAFLPKMLEQKFGHLVAISSVAGIIGAPGLSGIHN